MKLLKKTAVWLLAASMCFGSAAFAAEIPQHSKKMNKLPQEVKEALDKTIHSIPELRLLQLESIDHSKGWSMNPTSIMTTKTTKMTRKNGHLSGMSEVPLEGQTNTFPSR